MAEKEGKRDPILTMSTPILKKDILIFKNETLKDFKEAQQVVQDKYKKLDYEIKERLDKYEERIKSYENKIIELSNKINTDKTIREKVDNLIEFKEKADDIMLTEKIRLDNFRNDLKSNVERIDKILTDSVIYPGVIGGINKFKNFHQLIDYVLTECSQNLTFREKSILDFKGYKNKLENLITSFNTQINTLLNTTSEYTKSCVKELEEKIQSNFNIYDDRLQDSRLENANYAIGLEKATELLKKEMENLYVIKNELYQKVDSGILEVKNDNTRVVTLFSGYKKNFNLIKHKFNQLSDFIKDIRFRINIKEDVQRREYSHMSDMINFEKKKKPGFYDGVFDLSILKKGLQSQLKDYIEGKITADQLLKRKPEQNKNGSNHKESNSEKKSRSSSNVKSANENVKKEKSNFMDILRNSMTRKEIKEDENENNLSEEMNLNPIFSKSTKDRVLNKMFERETETGDFKMDSGKKFENNNYNLTKHKSEDNKIQIISKDLNTNSIIQDNKDNITSEENKNRPRLKSAINNLFRAKHIISELKSDINIHKLKPDIIRENKIKEDKIKEDKIQENKIKEDKIKENKIKDDKHKEDKIKTEIKSDNISKNNSNKKEKNLTIEVTNEYNKKLNKQNNRAPEMQSKNGSVRKDITNIKSNENKMKTDKGYSIGKIISGNKNLNINTIEEFPFSGKEKSKKKIVLNQTQVQDIKGNKSRLNSSSNKNPNILSLNNSLNNNFNIELVKKNETKKIEGIVNKLNKYLPLGCTYVNEDTYFNIVK